MALCRALFSFLALPGVVAGALPVVILGGRFHPARTAWAGSVLMAVGTVLLLWCVRDFFVSGKGTIAPWDPPKRLVAVGLYRFVRNPMYIAVLLLVAGWALAFGSGPMGLYLLILAVGFHLRVLFGEEPWLRVRFGAEWNAYAHGVPRWRPRLRPWRPPARPGGTGVLPK
jgi:protein-S-isoprenylcysteine O-methyltransferase Ste14